MFCETCGKQLPDGAKFCNGCGAQIVPAQSVNAQAERPAVNTAEPTVYYKPPAQSAPPPPQTYAPPQQTYTPPASYSHWQGSEPLRVGQYIGMFLLMSIPLVGIILLFMWSFGGSVNPNKKNFARAILILSVIGVIISIIFGAALTSILGGLMSSLGSTGGYY